MTPSTQNLELIPKPFELKKICRTLSALEAILCPDRSIRSFTYENQGDTKELCTYYDGSGSEIAILFCEEGACINGFDNESPMNRWKDPSDDWEVGFTQETYKGVIDELPEVFHEILEETSGSTFCIWWTHTDNEWKIGSIDYPDPEEDPDETDGSAYLLRNLDGNPSTIKEHIKNVYEREINLEIIENVLNGEAITKELAQELNPQMNGYEQLKSDLEKIGFPYQL